MPQPEVTPFQDVPLSVTPQQMGAGLGQTVSRIGDTASDIHFAAVDHANQTAVLDADNQMEQAVQQGLYDPKAGVLNQKSGADAPGLVDNALSQYDSQVAKVAGGLANDRQRAQFQQLAQQRRFHVEHELGQYEHAETTRHANEVDDGSIALQQNRAVQNATNPEQVYNAVDHIKAVLADAGVRNGVAPEETKKQQADAASETYLATLHQLVSTGHDQEARALFDGNREEFTAKDLPTASKLVEAGTTAGESQRITASIVRKPDGSFRTRSEVQNLIDGDPKLAADPKLLDAVRTRSEQAINQHLQAVNEDQADAVKEAYTIANDPANEQGLYNPKAVSLMATMDPQQQEYLKSVIQRGSVNPDRVRSMMTEAAANPDAFLASMQDPTLIADVGAKAFTELKAAEKEIREKGSLASAAGILTRNGVLDDALASAGYAKTSSGTGMTEIDRNAPGARALMSALDERIRATELATGRAMTPKEMKTLADEVTIEHAVQPAGTIYGYKAAAPVYTLTPDQLKTSGRDFEAFAQQYPDKAAQIRQNVNTIAGKIGVAPDKLTGSQYSRALAQILIAKEMAASGNRAAAQAATDQFNAIIRETPVARVDVAGVTPQEELPATDEPIFTDLSGP